MFAAPLTSRAEPDSVLTPQSRPFPASGTGCVDFYRLVEAEHAAGPAPRDCAKRPQPTRAEKRSDTDLVADAPAQTYFDDSSQPTLTERLSLLWPAWEVDHRAPVGLSADTARVSQPCRSQAILRARHPET